MIFTDLRSSDYYLKIFIKDRFIIAPLKTIPSKLFCSRIFPIPSPNGPELIIRQNSQSCKSSNQNENDPKYLYIYFKKADSLN